MVPNLVGLLAAPGYVTSPLIHSTNARHHRIFVGERSVHFELSALLSIPCKRPTTSAPHPHQPILCPLFLSCQSYSLAVLENHPGKGLPEQDGSHEHHTAIALTWNTVLAGARVAGNEHKTRMPIGNLLVRPPAPGKGQDSLAWECCQV